MPLTKLPLAGIPLSTPAIVEAVPDDHLLLQSDTPYWIVGTTAQGQVNWSLAQGTFPRIDVDGPNAYRLRDDPWVYVPTGDLAAYAILGTAVPEPTATMLALIACARIGILRRRR